MIIKVVMIKILPVIRQEISERRMEASARNPRKKIAVRIPPIIERTSIVRLLFCAIPLFFKMEDCINQ